ncbi:hypothetical protein BGW36DRAFT_374886 [Talaromyces proteolyticus]|uniref:DUF1446-domain-containing protein n=1 Tax=Talaromyces proteolyticus TaxID=1131652 RepID=A0AAD4Q2U6_9EURO|nr:uncharacterized protein BGW36DRAFT_374886 [Talaromyces proteolyticus]KAH8700746.1 hypothetical protein BGW36DRAFT_374886 [Talaromyces proteolyticus]
MILLKMTAKKCLRVGNVSGATGDSPTAMSRMARHGNVDVIVGDWLSEMNIAWNAITKSQDPELGYESGFLSQLVESLDVVIERGIKVITNAGALNTPSLAREVEELCRRKGCEQVIVAQVLGDDISDLVTNSDGLEHNSGLHHLDHEDWRLRDWKLRPHCGVAYIGAWGIYEALQHGAQIVICGRVTDASPVIGAAAWWYGWKKDDWNKLAGALVAGHLIECGPYITGANFSGFKDFLPQLVDLSFPIAEIDDTGACTITKIEQYGGAITKFNTIAQLLYELQGELYLNPDTVADLQEIRVTQTAPDRVTVDGVKGMPPPATTKAMIAAPGGYQAEATFYINGLDVPEKAQMMKQQLKSAFRNNNFSKFSVEVYGTPTSDPQSQQAGTVSLRVFAQAREKKDISSDKFKTPIYALRMQSYPGYHMNLDFRTMDPKPFMEIFPVIVSQCLIKQTVKLSSGKTIEIPPPVLTSEYQLQRPSYETDSPVSLDYFGPTERAPLGSIVHARSGDKADNFNVGIFVRHEDEYPWLQSFLTISCFKKLLGNDWKDLTETGIKRSIERCEFPNILAVHFRVLDFLGGGIASSARIDGLGKGIGEYIRSRIVDVPVRFLARGRI